MDHAQATEMFSSYWDEELEPDKASQLEDHLRSCLVCRREYQQFQQTVGGVHSLGHVTAPQAFAEGVVRRVRKRSGGRFFGSRRVPERVPYELFSLLMLGIILAIYLVLQLSQPGRVRLP